jgi:chorismate mutase/prephenate dehydratase
MSTVATPPTPRVVSYLGPPGTYTHAAALAIFGHASPRERTPEYREAATIDAVARDVRDGRASAGVLPIENSTEGSVTHTIDALLEGDVVIVRELVLPIEHALASHAASLGDIARVHSHPQALAQCRAWLARTWTSVELIASASTAAAVLAASKDPNAAAIASHLAAELHGVPVVAERVNDREGNATRFVVVVARETGAYDELPSGPCKTTLAFTLRHEQGALLRALAVLNDHGINLCRIESRPSRSKAWEYVFLVDLEGHRLDAPIARAMVALSQCCSSVRHLGSYPRAT